VPGFKGMLFARPPSKGDYDDSSSDDEELCLLLTKCFPASGGVLIHLSPSYVLVTKPGYLEVRSR